MFSHKFWNIELNHVYQRTTLLEPLSLGAIGEANLNAYTSAEWTKGKWMINPGVRLDYFIFNVEDKLQPATVTQTVFKPLPGLVIQPSLWFLYLQQAFVYVGDEAVVEPSGETQRFGVDVSVRYQPLKWLYLDADVNYAHPRALGEPKGEDYIPLAPTLTSVGGIAVRFDSRLRNESEPVSEICYTPGNPFFLKAGVKISF